MHCHCGTNNRTPWWTFTDPCKLEVRPDARGGSPVWLATPAMNEGHFKGRGFAFESQDCGFESQDSLILYFPLSTRPWQVD